MAGFNADSSAAELAHALARAGEQLAELDSANEQAGELIAAGPAPQRSGLLAASVQTAVFGGGVAVAGGTRYWTFVHWGAPGRNVRAQPWLLRQLETHTAEVIDIYTQHATDVLADIRS